MTTRHDDDGPGGRDEADAEDGLKPGRADHDDGGGGSGGAGEDDPLPGADVDGLSVRQQQAILALLNQPTIKAAAKSCGVGERTLYRWLRDPDFARAFRAARRDSFAHAVSLAQRYASLAVHTLAKLMSDPACGHSAKVAAATGILKFGRESIELDEMVGRIEALEGAAKSDGEGGGGGGSGGVGVGNGVPPHRGVRPCP